MRVSFATLGCKVNHYESEAMQELFTAAGWETVPFGEAADAVIVNTCTVTGTSDFKSRQLIARAHRANPAAVIAVAGCYAQTAPGRVSDLPGVTIVIGTDRRKDIVELVTAALGGEKQTLVKKLSDLREFEALSAVCDGRTRATLKIQDGCVNFCSYCAIPFARGPLRSRPLESCEKELRRLAAGGYREIVLTGIHLNSYGLDSGEGDLLTVVELANGVPGVDRVRLGSLEPKYIDERFCARASKMPSLCPQFHLSLQSGSDTVLKLMKRRYTAAEYAESARLLRAYFPGCAITTDVIAGFPGETEREHAETLAFCEVIGFARMHVFPFSLRKGTAAEKLPDHLTNAVKEARAKELIALGKALEKRYLESLVGKDLEVLAETDGEGYSREYARVRTAAPEGSVVRIRAERLDGFILEGKELTTL